MPKIVDHDDRRRDIAQAVLRVVAREGVRGTNLRSVADEAGCSTGLIHHYLGDKRALLIAALREAVADVGERMAAIQRLKRGDDRILALLEAGMPLDDERAATCRIFFHFSAEGFNDAALRQELASYYGWWRAGLREAIEAAQAEGRFGAFDATSLSEQLVAVAEGLGIQGTFDPETMNPERLRSHIASIVTYLGDSSANKGA